MEVGWRGGGGSLRKKVGREGGSGLEGGGGGEEESGKRRWKWVGVIYIKIERLVRSAMSRWLLNLRSSQQWQEIYTQQRQQQQQQQQQQQLQQQQKACTRCCSLTLIRLLANFANTK